MPSRFSFVSLILFDQLNVVDLIYAENDFGGIDKKSALGKNNFPANYRRHEISLLYFVFEPRSIRKYFDFLAAI